MKMLEQFCRQFRALGGLLVCAVVLVLPARANDPGTVDASFNPRITAGGGTFDALVVQPDGKIIAVGVFFLVGGEPHSCIVRLNADGSVDSSFIAQADAEVAAVALQNDGKILIGGYFGKVNGAARAGIARLNADGTLDSSFSSANGVSMTDATLSIYTTIAKIALQGDGKILIGGFFDQVNGVARTSLARLNADGTVDGGFAPTLVETDTEDFSRPAVRAIVVQPNGRILLGGGFVRVNGAAFTNLARLNDDGSLDSSFVSAGPDSITTFGYYYAYDTAVASLALQSDGKIVAGGSFTSVHGTARPYLARFNADGSLDSNYNPSSAFSNSFYGAYDVTAQPDDKIIVGGSFSTVPANQGGGYGGHQNSFIRVNTDGSLDSSFVGDTSTGVNDGAGGDIMQVSAVAVQADGALVVGGDFMIVDSVQRAGLARVNPDGTLDGAFQPSVQMRGLLFGLEVATDGKIVIGGSFESVNGVPRYNLARLNADGTLDSTFAPDLSAGYTAGVNYTLTIESLAVQNDAKVLYTAIQIVHNPGSNQSTAVVSYIFARVNADGSADTTFNVTFDSAAHLLGVVAPQADGKIYIGGDFTMVNGFARAGFARLNADGSVDTTFQSLPPLVSLSSGSGGVAARIDHIIPLSDGKILVGGSFSFTDSSSPVDLVRLNADGSLDSTFHVELPKIQNGARIPVTDGLAVQPDGRILISGALDLSNGFLGRLNADGSVDSSFSGPPGATTIVPQPDGKILVGGYFAQIGGVPNNGIARLNSDGSLDTTFNLTITDRSRSTPVPQYVYGASLQGDGKILVGGLFDLVNDVTQTAIVRLEGDSGSRLLNISTRLAVGTGENELIGGFIITGTDPKTVLIRGIGPSLPGVGGTLADPTLELHQGSAAIATNDNWKIDDQTGQSQEAAIAATTIPPTNDLESAILVTLNPGAYTAILAGKNGTTGVGLVEVYDLAQGANAQLANISTRGFVQTGDGVMIGGFIVGSGTANVGGIAQVMVRGLGPSLAASGISGALADPALELHDENGNTIATNDNWKTASNGSSQEAAIVATTIPPSNDLESALLASLGPGNYTAIVKGADGGTGVGLVESYNLQ